MKKLLLLILVFTMTIGLNACVSTNSLNDYKNKLDEVSLELEELQAEIDADAIATEAQLEAFILALEALSTRLDNIGSITGLGGVERYYETYEDTLQTMSAMELTVAEMKDTFDKTKSPSYLMDDEGNYVSFEQLAYKLKAKYFNDETIHEVDLFLMGSEAYFRFGITSDISEEELVARITLMIEELRLYEFYLLSSPELVIHIYRFDTVDHQTKITIPLTVVINDFFVLTCDGIFDSDYDMRAEFDTELDLVLIQAYYDGFVLNGIFDNYVLNYTK